MDLYVAAYAPDRLQRYVDKWARECACALVPRALRIFPRHRWLTSFDGCIDDVTLLACTHNLLSRASPIWLAALKGKDVTEVRVGCVIHALHVKLV